MSQYYVSRFCLILFLRASKIFTILCVHSCLVIQHITVVICSWNDVLGVDTASASTILYSCRGCHSSAEPFMFWTEQSQIICVFCHLTKPVYSAPGVRGTNHSLCKDRAFAETGPSLGSIPCRVWAFAGTEPLPGPSSRWAIAFVWTEPSLGPSLWRDH